MDKPIIIFSHAGDYHAAAVKWALEKRGQDVLLWEGFGEAGPGHATCISGRSSSAVKLDGRSCDAFASAWFRRRSPCRSLKEVHPDGVGFLKNEASSAHEALSLSVESRSDYVVGGVASRRASSKLLQLEVARSVGLAVPETIVSNDYGQVAQFASRFERILVKHFLPHYWGHTTDGRITGVAPSIIENVASMNRRSIEICPAIYQELVHKAYEIRVTVIGERLFAARIASRQGEAFLDWRQEYGNSDMVMSAMTLDAVTARGVRSFMDALDLRFGCFDFAVDHEGTPFFLEVNPGGQFLFVEEYVPQLHLLDAFVSMLVEGSPRYRLSSDDAITDAAFMDSPEYDLWTRERALSGTDERFVTFV